MEKEEEDERDLGATPKAPKYWLDSTPSEDGLLFPRPIDDMCGGPSCWEKLPYAYVFKTHVQSWSQHTWRPDPWSVMKDFLRAA